MKKISIYFCAMFVALLFSSCEEELVTYGGADYVIFDGLAANVAENGGAYTVTVLRSNASQAITANLAINSYFADEPATAATGTYTVSSTSLSFGVDEYSTTFTIAPVNNNIGDGTKVVEISLSDISQDGVTAGFPGDSKFNGKFVFTIADDDCPPEFALTNTWFGTVYCDDLGYTTNLVGTGSPTGTCGELSVNANLIGATGTIVIQFTKSTVTPTQGTVVVNRQVYRSNGEEYEGTGTYNESTGAILINYSYYRANGTFWFPGTNNIDLTN